MAYRILGELTVLGESGPLLITSDRQRAVLALLLLEANRVVPVDRLIDGVWDGAPPDTARSQIHICVSRLRRSLRGAGVTDALVTRTPGYLIEVAEEHLDLHVFDRLTAAGRAAFAAGELAEAAERYGEALGLWRGQALAGLEGPAVRTAAQALEERRLAVLEERVEAVLRLGKHHEVIDELITLVATHPLRERPLALLMISLYRDGRTAESLEVYRRARERFVEELGLEPGESLQRLEQAILAGDAGERRGPLLTDSAEPATALAPARGPGVGAGLGAGVPCLLPADIADFSGRARLIEQLRAALLPAEPSRSDPLPLAALSGRGGLGKTTAAIHLAHGLTDRYPDGQLFAALRGTTGDPMPPTEVLARFLRVLGMPDATIPADQEGRAELYRDCLAGLRVLVVLDDAASEEQVMPLLPGTGTCALVVTSRRRLTRLPGAHRVDLRPLTAGPALELLTRVIGAERVDAEPEAARTVVHCCAGLPLALRMAGARAAAKPHWTLRHLAARMEDERRRLDELAAGGAGIRSSIAAACEGLPEPARRLLRRLGLLPDTDFAASVAAPLLSSGADEADEALEALVDARLVDVERADPDGPRYRLPSLIRVYARERLAAEDSSAEQRAAQARLRTHVSR